MPLPNPFNIPPKVPREFATALTLPNPFQQPVAAGSPPAAPATEAAAPVETPPDRQQGAAAAFEPDMERMYEHIVGHDDVPLFLRKPSPDFMRALFNLSDNDRHIDRENGSDSRYD